MEKNTPFKIKQHGQVLLIVVLVMVVSLTIILSVALRSVVSRRIATEDDYSQRALEAAEAGIEQTLKTGAGVKFTQGLGNSASFLPVKIIPIQGPDILLRGGNTIPKDDGATIWLVPHTNTNPPEPDFSPAQIKDNWRMDLYWGTKDDPCDDAAVEIIIVSGTPNSPVVIREAFDPCDARRLGATGNHFEQPIPSGATGGSSIGTITFKYKTKIKDKISGPGNGAIDDGLLIRIIPLYADTPFGAKVYGGSPEFPAQAQRIESTGISAGTSRKISLVRGFPELPSEFFPYVLFSPKKYP